ncbi:MAG: TIM barrel protein [Candidatus Nezhaarchaeota archaeon]|nr:TIM barrel protein [Candidatus Nezhaarchaeota archaeon]MCX8142531.1 TIM barrel protein [Candidatus Nezhaarchaeota archaeon]MDW8050496.1 deoxyribonuclease IV [Nitrososphaerota archaeon]
MRALNDLLFGTAGIPISTPKPATSVNGILRVRELGLGAMELEFVRGVRMSDDLAYKVRSVSEAAKVVLTAHAPYYINLNSPDRSKVEASIGRILDTARVAYKAGGWSIVFHPAYYGGDPPSIVYDRVKESLKRIVRALRDEGVEIWVRPETSGGLAEFGSLEEVVRLSLDVEMVLPCIDFAHIHARTLGKYNGYEEFVEILNYLEKELGKEVLRNMHMHFSGIEYGDRGEVKHVNLDESDFNYRELAKILKDYSIRGVIISESPNIEGDALILKRAYEEG